MQTVTSGRLGVVAAIAAVVLGAGGVAFAGNALATPSGSRAATATVQDDCAEYDTVRPSTRSDDCDDDDRDHPVCPTATYTDAPEDLSLQGDHRKKPRPHETPTWDCPTPTETSTAPTESPTESPTTPTETLTEPPTPSPTSPSVTETSPEPVPTTPTATPTPCDTASDDDDCGIVTEPPAFTG